ncbi:MAG: DnaD domain protein [Clostridia bacterium]|nr:DnaD domain protein [Clostridia bacterium]
MKYLINAEAYIGAFPMPSIAVDKYIKLSSAVQLKVLLVCMRNSSAPIESEEIARILNISEKDVEDALIYWSGCGILTAQVPTAKAIEKEEEFVSRCEKPTREDVARRGNEDKKIRFLLSEAQLKFGRNLKMNEASTFVWLCDDVGIDVSVLLLLIEYAASENSKNITFIEKTALKWKQRGVETVLDAEKQIAEEATKKLAVAVVQKAFGIERRKPSEKELSLCNIWINDWGISTELLVGAYNICIDKNAKLSFPYIHKILESWHKKGYKTAADIEKGEQVKKAQKEDKKGFAAYDLDAFERMLNSDD